MFPNWKVKAISEETPKVILAGRAEVCIQKAIHEINTDKYVGMKAWNFFLIF